MHLKNLKYILYFKRSFILYILYIWDNLKIQNTYFMIYIVYTLFNKNIYISHIICMKSFYKNTNFYLYIYIYIYIYVCVCVCVCVYVFAHTHTHIYVVSLQNYISCNINDMKVHIILQ